MQPKNINILTVPILNTTVTGCGKLVEAVNGLYSKSVRVLLKKKESYSTEREIHLGKRAYARVVVQPVAHVLAAEHHNRGSTPCTSNGSLDNLNAPVKLKEPCKPTDNTLPLLILPSGSLYFYWLSQASTPFWLEIISSK